MARDLALEKCWRERIKECRQSGLTVKAWCLQNEVTDKAFYYWMKRFKVLDQQESIDNIFVEVPLPRNSKSKSHENFLPVSMGLTLSFGSYSINIPNEFNPDTLEKIVKVLQKL